MERTTRKKKAPQAPIAQNRRARHEYTIEQTLEAGIVLQGWEVKSLRAGRAHLNESYVVVKQGEAWLLGASIQPLHAASTHIHCDPQRSRKLLLKQRELNKLHGAIQRQGYTGVALALCWKGAWCKVQIGIAKGKKAFDKREVLKTRSWQLTKAQLLKQKQR